MSAASWSDPAVIVQAVAVVVAAVAAVAVIWQAHLTRRALRDAGESLLVAQQSLEVARQAGAHAALMSSEAVKLRIAANAPRADLAGGVDEMVVITPGSGIRGYRLPWPAIETFHVRDKHLPLTVRVPVILRNTGTAATRFVVWGALRQPVEDAAGELVVMKPGPANYLLDPGRGAHGFWEVTRTLEEWIEVYDLRQRGEQIESDLVVHVDDGHDTGASYRFTLRMGGTLVRPSEAGLREAWRLTGAFGTDEPDGIGLGAQPLQVRYWLSKLQERPLPENAADVWPA
ncbi:hypothetical protein [Microbacterium enclense]|uniref:Uncharacterized protein n=1 Tax=Microbacterium enclense TaxID=993073 RepID=A0A1G6JDZ4_9MICO|nr:hypothetical protein [Microbacterium enclense]KSU54822.1 hypothetical protein AS029_07700 [Microbacterium enclense]SDC16998.1 hypothetical protein SAMN05216418_1798 [Microbacterium enclense]